MSSNRWVFRSESRPGVYHVVEKFDHHFVCSCPAYRFQRGKCRHILLVKHGLPENFRFDEPQIIEAHVNRPVMVGGKILIPFYAKGDVRMAWWIIKHLREFGLSRRRCEQYFKVKIPMKNDIEQKAEEVAPKVEGSRFPLLAVRP